MSIPYMVSTLDSTDSNPMIHAFGLKSGKDAGEFGAGFVNNWTAPMS